jgi:hypothetical protein
MFFTLAKHAEDVEDVYHYVKKIDLTSTSAHTNFVNLLVGIGSVCLSLLQKQTENPKLKPKIYRKFLQLMREVKPFLFKK